MRTAELVAGTSCGISDAPYNYSPTELQLVVDTPEAERGARQKERGNEIPSLRRGFWIFQMLAMACLIFVETIPAYLGMLLPYFKYIGLGLLLIATECAFLQKRRAKANDAEEASHWRRS